MSPKYLFAFLRYLRTAQPVRYRGLTFRQSADTNDIPQEVQNDFTILKDMFFLSDNYRLQDTTYAVAKLTDSEEDQILFDTLSEVQTIVAYLYSAPRSEFNDIFLSAHDGHAGASRRER